MGGSGLQRNFNAGQSVGLMDNNDGLQVIDHRSSVIIVDDQFTGRKILQELIQSIDSELLVESFSGPLEALERAIQIIPDLVITDYRMPELDGIEFIKRLRVAEGCEDIPLVVVTVVDDPKIRYEALDAGATDFLVRPIDQHECRARCRNLLTMRKQQKIIKDHALRLEEQIESATRQVRERERETLLRMAMVGEYRDENEGARNHILRLAKISRLLAEQLGLPEAECEEIELAAPLHDIGKIGVPDELLLSPDELSEEGWAQMRDHTTIGHRILVDSPSRYIKTGATIALAHHEKFDGSGYPAGLQGEDIPLSARIVAIVDVYDSLTTERPYNAAWSVDEAVAYIKDHAGTHFDPACVDAFLAQIDAIKRVEIELKDTIVNS